MRNIFLQNKELVVSLLFLLTSIILTIHAYLTIHIGITLLIAIIAFYRGKKKLIRRASTNKAKTSYAIIQKLIELISLIIISIRINIVPELGYLIIASYGLLEILKNTLRIEMQVIPTTILNTYERTLLIAAILIVSILNPYILFYGGILYILATLTDSSYLTYKNIYKK